MNVHYKAKIRGSKLNPQHLRDHHPSKDTGFSLPYSAPTQTGNFSISPASMIHEWIGGTLKVNHKSSPISPLSPQETGSDGLPQMIQSPECQSNDRSRMSDFCVQGSLQTDCSFGVQESFHEGFPHSNGNPFHASPSIQNYPSSGSPTSSQTSQTYTCNSPYFHSPEDCFGPAISQYSGNDRQAGASHMLEEIETSLMGPDTADPDNFAAMYEGCRLSGNAEWSLEALRDINDFLCQESQPDDPKRENIGIFPVTENRQRSMDCRKSVKIECMNGVEIKKEIHPFKSPSGGQQWLKDHRESVKIESMNGVDMKNDFYPSTNALVLQKQVQLFKNPGGAISQLLITCAKAIADCDLVKAGNLIQQLRQRVSISGDPMQRLGAYMLEGLIARLNSSGGRIYKSQKCKEPASAELLSYIQILYEACPYFKFGYVAANGAIAEALKDEDRVHIIDFQIAQGNQWVSLIQAFGARKGSPPHVRITGVYDPISEYARGGGLQLVSQRLSKLAETCGLPFEFHALPMLSSDVEANMLEVANMLELRSGEALAVNFAFQLHQMPDESVSTSNPRDRLLRMVKGLAPKVMTLVEQEFNTNTAPFFPRFKEAMSYYSAVFESLDVTLPRESKERVNIEQHCLASDIVNIIACEGAERVERHEVLGKWRSRLTMAGFKPYPLSSYVNFTIKTLLERYCENYRLEEKDEAVYLGWLNRPLIVASAWH
eukprot:Gb_03122 [translate_table: standard]